MNSWEYSDGTDGQPNNSGGSGDGLRKYAEAQSKENKELRDQLAAIQRDLAMQKVQSVFDSAGVPGAAALYQGDADPAKAKEWVSQLQSVFGASGGVTPQVPTATQAPLLSPEEQQQMQRMNEAGAAGTPLTSMEQAMNSAKQVTSMDELIANFQNAARNAQQ